jgi:hypothetical protein
MHSDTVADFGDYKQVADYSLSRVAGSVRVTAHIVTVKVD